MKTKIAVLLLCLPLSAVAGKDFEVIGGNQNDFREISEDIIATIEYKAQGPSEASGLTGFSAGVFATYVPVDNKASWKTATGEDVNEIGLVGVHATKGLPLGIDVGAYVSTVPTADITAYGAELRLAILEGGVASPGLALRGSYSKLSGIDNFDVDSKSVDLSVSKGFAFLTPYAGAGYVRGESDPDDSVPTLSKVKYSGKKLFAGVRLGLGLLEITPEYSRIVDNNVYSLKFGLGL